MSKIWETVRGWISIGIAYLRGFFAVRLFKMDTNLYQSGQIEGIWSLRALKNQKITHVVDLEGSMDRYADRFIWYLYWPIHDGALPADMDKLWQVARQVQDFTLKGYRVLVHCQGGCNRSSLVNGCVLYLRGYRGKDIVTKIRKGRPGALTNWVFREYLESLIK